MSSPQQSDEMLREELVAYLDGELSAADSESIELRISKDDFAREELQQFDRIWNALDELPRVEVGDGFTKTTIEMAAVEAQKELAAETAMLPVRKRNRRLKTIGMIAAAVVVGFAALGVLAPNQNLQLYNNLPVIMQLDAYSEAHDVDFLRLLHANCGDWLLKEWASEVDDDVVSLEQLTTASYRDRVTFVENLPADRRTELASQHQRYESLSSDKRAELASWHQTMASDPDAEVLQKTMLAYYAWLSRIPESDQFRLRALPADERVARVEQMHREAVQKDLSRLTPANAAALRKAMNRMAQDPKILRLQAEMQAAIPDLDQREEQFPPRLIEGLNRMKETSPQMAMRGVLWISAGAQPAKGVFPKFEAYSQAIEDGLMSALDDEAASRLRGFDEGHRRGLLTYWLWIASQDRPSKLDVATLEEYFSNGDLSDEDKAVLLAMPKEQMMTELQFRYYKEYFADEEQRDRMDEVFRSFGQRPWGRGPGGRYNGRGGPRGGDDRGPRGDDRGGPRGEDSDAMQNGDRGGPGGNERGGGPRNGGERGPRGEQGGPRGEMGPRGNQGGPPFGPRGPADEQPGPGPRPNDAPPAERNATDNKPAADLDAADNTPASPAAESSESPAGTSESTTE
ncbi:collagen-like triple helix repeat-containing protein [Aeoliella mucimassa]|uniref:Uncharacterized protein n=1 Tax=Aeoliella mucimassa TaxID=2527972 RepID=A0A518AHS5_9BACT|nr:collagen-like protein [Aeoliella mucimassa]QDU54283.1 hypothetical protein Pan181_04640 [Aeoliella mucimassa]